MVEILGGTANSGNALMYYSEHFQSVTLLDKKTSTFSTEVTKSYIGVEKWYSKIPLLRGLVINFYQKWVQGKTIIVDLFSVIGLILYVIDKIFWHYNIVNYLFISSMFFKMILAFMNKEFTKIHGSEHMVFNYYNQHKSVKIEDINEIRKSSRIHPRCGTIGFGLTLVIFVLLSLLFKDFLVCYFLNIAISAELVDEIDNKYIRIVLYPFIKFSEFFQKYFFTRNPDDIHIEMAISAIHALEKSENEYQEE